MIKCFKFILQNKTLEVITELPIVKKCEYYFLFDLNFEVLCQDM